MIIVTGGAGFIGSNLIKALNSAGHDDILVVDDLTDGHKCVNLADLKILDFEDKTAFINKIKSGASLPEKVEVIFHQGACAVTTEWDGKYMLENNYEYSKHLLHFALSQKIPFIYASSAAVYGSSKTFNDDNTLDEKPLNVYGYSKLLFDQYLRRLLPKIQSQVAGLRYFNVYGPNEAHKGSMASTAWHFNKQLLKDGRIKLFVGSHGYANGEQKRDFVFVDDVVAINLWLWKNKQVSGVFNVGTGRAATFNEVARQIIAFHGHGKMEYIPFPDGLEKAYQSFTEANLNKLRAAGCQHEFQPIAVGIKKYLTAIAGK